MKIYFATDHRGFTIARELDLWMKEKGYIPKWLGPDKLTPGDDYADYAKDVAYRVAQKISFGEEARGILLCGSGVGMDIAANRIKGIRCGLGISEGQIRAARADDDINILTIAADFVDLETAKRMVQAFLETPFKNEEKYKRRIEKIEQPL